MTLHFLSFLSPTLLLCKGSTKPQILVWLNSRMNTLRNNTGTTEWLLGLISTYSAEIPAYSQMLTPTVHSQTTLRKLTIDNLCWCFVKKTSTNIDGLFQRNQCGMLWNNWCSPLDVFLVSLPDAIWQIGVNRKKMFGITTLSWLLPRTQDQVRRKGVSVLEFFK